MKTPAFLFQNFLLVVFTLLIALPSDGQILANRIITDLYPGATGSYPTNFFVYKDSLIFSAYTTNYGREPWKFDGTSVSLISNINNTVTDSGGGVFIGNNSSPGGFVTYSNVLYFSAYEPTNGTELWRYNGTNASRVTDINPSTGNSFPQQLTVMSNELFFVADSGISKPNYELWKYNGTSAIQITNIHPDSGSDFSSYPSGITLFNNALYFMADDGTHGYELWKASSTNAVLLSDINAGNASSSSYPGNFISFSNRLYFSAFTSASGYELWQTDGTNVTQVANLNPGSNSSFPQNLTVFGNALYFQANDGTNGYELWKYDGTILSLVSNINLAGDAFAKNLTVFSNTLCFAANDGTHGWELWKYDGTNASLVMDLNPDGDAFPEHLIVFSNALYFVATTFEAGYEWWKFDGTTVKLAADINPGTGSSFPQAQVVFNGSLAFNATDDGFSNWEPWIIWFAPFQITAIDQLGGNVRLTWKTAGGLTNIVQSSDTINGAFTNLSDSILIPSSGETTASYTNAIDTGSRFYRIIQP